MAVHVDASTSGTTVGMIPDARGIHGVVLRIDHDVTPTEELGSLLIEEDVLRGGATEDLRAEIHLPVRHPSLKVKSELVVIGACRMASGLRNIDDNLTSAEDIADSLDNLKDLVDEMQEGDSDEAGTKPLESGGILPDKVSNDSRCVASACKSSAQFLEDRSRRSVGLVERIRGLPTVSDTVKETSRHAGGAGHVVPRPASHEDSVGIAQTLAVGGEERIGRRDVG